MKALVFEAMAKLPHMKISSAGIVVEYINLHIHVCSVCIHIHEKIDENRQLAIREIDRPIDG